MRQRLSAALMLACLAGCGGGNRAKQQETSPPPSAIKPENEINAGKEKTDLSETNELACVQFFKAVDASLAHHVSRNSSERGKLLAAGYARALDTVAENHISGPKPAGAFRQLVQAAGDHISTCEPYLSAAEKLKDLMSLKTSPLIGLLRYSLYWTLTEMDYYSSYYVENPDSEKTPWGAGIKLRYRTDYALGRNAPYLAVERHYDNSPNKEILPDGSKITAIDGKPVSGMSYGEADALLNDAKKDKNAAAVSLLGSPDSVTLKMGEYESAMAFFDWRPVAGHRVARIRLSSFSAPNAGENFKDAWWQNGLRNHQGPPDGLILDLRGNSGGFYAQAKSVLETLLPVNSVYLREKIIVPPGENNGSIGGKPSLTYAQKTQQYHGLDVNAVIVLVDRKSASSSEHVIAALKDFERVEIIGERTFGKAIGQSKIFDLTPPLGGNGYVTDRLAFSPLGYSYQKTGIVPHIEIADPVLDFQQARYKKPVRMEDYAADETYRGLIIDRPADLPIDKSAVTPVDEPMRVSKETITKTKTYYDGLRSNPPEECKRLPGDPEFKEEDDCLLVWAEKLMPCLIQLKKDPNSGC